MGRLQPLVLAILIALVAGGSLREMLDRSRLISEVASLPPPPALPPPEAIEKVDPAYFP